MGKIENGKIIEKKKAPSRDVYQYGGTQKEKSSNI